MKRKKKTRKRRRVNLKQIQALADAILRGIAWRQNMMDLKQERKIRFMLKRQLLVKNFSRENSKSSLSN